MSDFLTASQTLYDVLSVSPKATAEELKSAFRKLALLHHPDRNGDSEESRAAFLIISHAYGILADEKTRSEYDNYLNTSRVIRKKVKAARPETDSLEYLTEQLNFILWEVEDVILHLKKTGEDRIAGGKTLRLWLLEILVFMDRWILDPAGFLNYFYEVRQIPGEKPWAKVTQTAGPDDYLPYVNIEDFFYDLRKRMNRFIEKVRLSDLSRKVGDQDIKLMDCVIEALMLSYHYLGGVNAVLKGQADSIVRFRHANSVYDRQQAILLS